jgi:hypothetical protein
MRLLLMGVSRTYMLLFHVGSFFTDRPAYCKIYEQLYVENLVNLFHRNHINYGNYCVNYAAPWLFFH